VLDPDLLAARAFDDVVESARDLGLFRACQGAPRNLLDSWRSRLVGSGSPGGLQPFVSAGNEGNENGEGKQNLLQAVRS
jgi:hypothetical protein